MNFSFFFRMGLRRKPNEQNGLYRLSLSIPGTPVINDKTSLVD